MAFGKNKNVVVEEHVSVEDPTGWMLDNPISEFILMHTFEIQFMCMLAYCFFGGVKVFSNASSTSSPSYKFINLIFTCTGGGILVPILLNGLPVSISNDNYVVCMLITFAVHSYFPIIREVYKISAIFRALVTVMFEVNRAFVLTKFTAMAGSTIPASTWSIPVFGPIMCGAISGCGGAFLPLNKGLDPLVKGLAPPMLTALFGAAGYHLYLNTSLSEGCIDAKEKARVHVALFFIVVGLVNTLDLGGGKKEDKSKKKQ